MSNPTLVAAMAAKAAYRGDPTPRNRDAYRAAADELRYARWVSRGGPDLEAARAAAGDGPSNRSAGAWYRRWLGEAQED